MLPKALEIVDNIAYNITSKLADGLCWESSCCWTNHMTSKRRRI